MPTTVSVAFLLPKDSIMTTQPVKELEAKPNPSPGREYEVEISTPEFTCLCPMTGQPDFATINVTYVPDEHIIELKSFKLYLWSYREEGIFHEKVANQILDDLVEAINPKRITVQGDFNVRGGVYTTVTASWEQDEA